MHNHVANSGRKALLKQIFSVFLIFTLYFNSFNSAYASTSLGGWTITQQIAQGASTAITATKTAIINGASVLKTSTAKITPNASQVAKVLRGGAYGYVISIALQQILGKTVDWVLDPANNTIKYMDVGQVGTYMVAGVTYKDMTLAQACQSARSGYLRYDATHCIYGTIDSSGNENTVARWGYITVTVPESEEKTIPLTTVAERVISNAETSSNQEQKAGAQAVTTAAAEDLLANDAPTQSDVENQLNTNSKTQTSESASGTSTPSTTNPQATNIALSFPVFCGWAPLVCEAAQSAIKFPTTVTNWWTTATTSITDAWTWTKARYEASVTSISDFFKNEPDQTDNTDLPVQEIPTPQLETNAFTATPGCPAPIPIQIKIGVEGTTHISYEPICQFASKWSFIAPLIGFLSGAMIIIGVGRKGEDSEI